MAKINIIKPTGSDTLSLLSAFKTENLTYVVFDSEKVGSMGLPIIYISKLTEKLEKVTDDNEWQSVKNSLKGIINGTSFEYIKVNDTMNADEAYYTPLTLPQSSFDLIKNRYVVIDNSGDGNTEVLEPKPLEPISTEATPIEDVSKTEEVSPSTMTSEAVPTVSTIPNISPVGPMPENGSEQSQESVGDLINSVTQTQNVPPVAPVMPNVSAESNASYVATPNVAQPAPVAAPTPEVTPAVNVAPVQEPDVPISKFDTDIFMQDKETFLKACENMFDALVSKYQKQLEDLERREQSLKTKEQEVQTKLNDANEHLANAEAREQVANIAHDNAQKVMDITNLMPNNPNAN